MVTKVRRVVQVRLMGEDSRAVELAAAALADALGERFAITGFVPNKREPGARCYGVILGHSLGEALPEDGGPQRAAMRNRRASPKAPKARSRTPRKPLRGPVVES